MSSDFEQFLINAMFMTYCQESGFKKKDIIGKRRTRQLTKARHDMMQLIRKHTSLSYSEIGKIFNRTHSTVLYACNKRGDK